MIRDLRGGQFANTASNLRASNNNNNTAANENNNIGFRVSNLRKTAIQPEWTERRRRTEFAPQFRFRKAPCIPVGSPKLPTNNRHPVAASNRTFGERRDWASLCIFVKMEGFYFVLKYFIDFVFIEILYLGLIEDK